MEFTMVHTETTASHQKHQLLPHLLLKWTASSLDWTAMEMEGPWFCVWTKVRMSWLSTEDYGGRRWMSTMPMLVGTSTLTTQEFFATRLLVINSFCGSILGFPPVCWATAQCILAVRLSGLLYIRSRLLKPVDHSSVLCITTTTTTCYCMWQLWLIPAMTVLYDVLPAVLNWVSANSTVGPACPNIHTSYQPFEATILDATAVVKEKKQD